MCGIYVQSRPETGEWGSPFEYCRGKCRTSSNSTVHENAYLEQDKHCFSVLGKGLWPWLLPLQLPVRKSAALSGMLSWP